MSLQLTLAFLNALASNNNKAWFEAHRDDYNRARGAFEETVDELIRGFATFDDMGFLTASECMFRINRDVRFSNDKSPYKTNLGAVIGRGGRKSTGRIYYLQVGANDSFAAGGLHEPGREQLDRVRRHIVNDATPMRAVIGTPEFTRYFGTMQGEQLKTAPRGYDRDHPDVDLLRYKQYLAVHPLSVEQIVADDLVDHLLQVYEAMKPFNVYLEQVANETA